MIKLVFSFIGIITMSFMFLMSAIFFKDLQIGLGCSFLLSSFLIGILTYQFVKSI